MNRAVVSFGSNINPEFNIHKAKRILAKTHPLISESDVVITKPMGYKDQPDFYNGAVLLDTEMELQTFNSWLKKIEDRLGRIRNGNMNGPRTIDLDIVVWNGSVKDSDIYSRLYLRNSVLQLLPDLSLEKPV
jgi:2-amino-4-hydroxy-6-hydroxymethyldihydropteridine diphosphokinase